MTDQQQAPDPARGAATEVHVESELNGLTAVRGTVRIAPAVLIELIDLTLQQIEGVAGLRNHQARKDDVPDGARMFSNGKIAVTVVGDQITAGIGIAIERGTNVSDLGSRIKQAIGFAVGNMLGMTVQAVDVYIQEVLPAST
jgi:uncharacterized alkaline shock family protein YloU